jgi:hypothetical protein
MAHFAQIENGIVTRVISVANEELLENGVENEAKGIDFCVNLFGGNWKQTSYNRKFRKNYAGIGYIYDEDRDAFIPPQPYFSWSLNEDTCLWDAPIAMPDDGKLYKWDESTISWIQA